MFKLAIELCSKNDFGLIHAIFLLLGSTKSVDQVCRPNLYTFLVHPVIHVFSILADAIPPMSLIEEWLRFPDNAANPYGKQQSRLNHYGQRRHKTVSQDVSDAVGPISQTHQWPFFPDGAYGPTEKKHRTGPRGSQPAQEQSRLYQSESEQGYENRRFASKALQDKRSVNEAYEDLDNENEDELREDLEQRLKQVLRNYKESISKDEIKENNDGAVFHSQGASHAGSHHHRNGADDVDYSRLERAADYLDSNFVLHVRESRDRGERDKIYRLEEDHQSESNLNHEEVNRLSDVRSRIRNSEEEVDVAERGGEDYPGRKLVEYQEKADLHLLDSVSHQREAIKETIQFGDSSKLHQSNNAQAQKVDGEEDSNKISENLQSSENSEEPVNSFEKDSESLPDRSAENPNEKQRNGAGDDSIVNDIANDGQGARVLKQTHEIVEHSEAEKHFYPAQIKDDRDVQQSLSAGMNMFVFAVGNCYLRQNTCSILSIPYLFLVVGCEKYLQRILVVILFMLRSYFPSNCTDFESVLWRHMFSTLR